MSQKSVSFARASQITINCDLGEGLDTIDAAVMPFINLANIACGGHAGDTESMRTTVALAAAHNVGIGAHPSYPDRENFGRKRISLSPHQLQDTLIQQVQSLSSIAKENNTRVTYIKPHGALYNDCVEPAILASLIRVAQDLNLPLMLMAGQPLIIDSCETAKVPLIREAFADRRYNEKAQLVARSQAGALLDAAQSLKQVRQLTEYQTITLPSGSIKPLACDTLCVHSDTDDSIAIIRQLKHYLSGPL